MDEQRVRQRIVEIAQRRNNVSLGDIEWVVNQLSEAYTVRSRQARHGMLYTIGNQRFMVNFHNPGNKQVKGYSVDSFLDAMTELGLYEE